MLATLNVKIDQATKTNLARKAKLRKMTLSEYVRLLLEEKENVKNKKRSPLLDLVGTLTPEEADRFEEDTKQARISKSQEDWEKILD